MNIKNHLLPSTIRRSEHEISHWFLRVVPGVTPADVASPDFWAHLAARIGVDDRIEVVAQDGSFDADLRVIAIDGRKQWAQVRVLRGWPEASWEPHKLDVPVLAEAKDYKYEFAGPHKFRIINATGDVVETHLPTKEAAIARIAALRAEKLVSAA